jgi:hypothetical protein
VVTLSVVPSLASVTTLPVTASGAGATVAVAVAGVPDELEPVDVVVVVLVLVVLVVVVLVPDVLGAPVPVLVVVLVLVVVVVDGVLAGAPVPVEAGGDVGSLGGVSPAVGGVDGACVSFEMRGPSCATAGSLSPSVAP